VCPSSTGGHRKSTKNNSVCRGEILYVIYIYNLRLANETAPRTFQGIWWYYCLCGMYNIHRASSSRLRNPAVRSSYSFLNFATRASSPSAGSSNFWELIGPTAPDLLPALGRFRWRHVSLRKGSSAPTVEGSDPHRGPRPPRVRPDLPHT